MSSVETVRTAKLYHGDCMELLATLPDKSIDLAVCDPPYGSSVDHSCRNYRIDRTGGKWFAKYGNKIAEWDIAPTQEYFNEVLRVSKRSIIWGGNYFSDKLPVSNNFIIYDKVNVHDKFSMAMCEYAWTDIKGNAKIFRHIPQDENRFHPTQKPIKLYQWILGQYAKPGDVVLDTHMGSMGLAVACIENGISFVGSEIDDEYFEKGLKRCREAVMQGRLF